jgi:LL-H family phage holin
VSDIIFELLKIVVMLAVLVFARYIIPYVQKRIGKENTELIAQWAKYAVLKAQQVLYSESGEDRKAYVTEFLKQLLIEKNISISDEQLDILIEAAVKQMKIEENSGIIIEAADEVQEKTE